MEEKAWEIFIPASNPTSQPEVLKHEFRSYADTEERARLSAQIQIVTELPADEGWVYDFNEMTIREITHDEMGERLEQRRKEIEEESKGILDDAVGELERQTVRKLNKLE